MAVCDLTTLETDACTNGFSKVAQNEILFRAVLLQLACNISGGTSGGGSTTCDDYGGLEPDFTPSSSCAIAIDTSTGYLWKYYSSGWH